MLRNRASKILILTTILITVSVSSLVVARSSNVRDSMALFTEVMRKVRDEYVDRVDLDKLVQGAIRGMMDTLDPHSQFLSTKQYNDLMVSTHGSFGGLGIEIDIRNDWLTVIAPIEGTPAYRVGIRGGDRIVRIEGKSTRGITITDAVQKLRGEKGTEVTISIQREGEADLLDYTLTRDIIKIKSVPFAALLDGGLGYVRVAAFSDETGEELRTVLRDLRSQGMQKLIVDLRRNTGGLLSQAIEVSEQFLEPDQTVVSTRGRMPQQNREYKAGRRAAGGDYPLVILVDHQSASASEIVAGAVQDLDRGLVVGLTTFGKGTVQSVMRLPGDNALKLTTAKYYTPSGRCINKYEGDDEAKAYILTDEAEADSARVYFTAGGREVYGGGGIRPDIEITREDMPKIASSLARRGLLFEYAVGYVVTHEEVGEDFADDPAFLQEFQEFLEEKEFEYTDEEFEDGRDFVTVMLRSEIARKVWGDEAAYRISIEGDPQLKKTIDLVNQASSLSDLFASANQYSETVEQ
jgi:carboxyl-terminal processing protease